MIILVYQSRLPMLIKKKRFHKLLFIPLKSVKSGGSKTVKNDGGGKMMVIFTIIEINCLIIGAFYHLVRPFIFVVRSASTALFALFPAEQQKWIWPFQTHLPFFSKPLFFSKRSSRQIIFKPNILSKFKLLIGPWFCFECFLNLAFYHIASKYWYRYLKQAANQ